MEKIFPFYLQQQGRIVAFCQCRKLRKSRSTAVFGSHGKSTSGHLKECKLIFKASPVLFFNQFGMRNGWGLGLFLFSRPIEIGIPKMDAGQNPH